MAPTPDAALPPFVTQLSLSFDFSAPGVYAKFKASGEALALDLDSAGLAVSSGAACASGDPEPSPVLLAMGRSRAEASGSLRFSLPRALTDPELERVTAAVEVAVARLRALGPGDRAESRVT